MSAARYDLPPIVVLPDGPYRVGDRVSARWTLTNYGDANAEGGTLRIEAAPGVTLDGESVRVSGLASNEALDAFSTDGVLLEELAPGASVAVEFTFSIGAVSERDELWLRAVVTWPDGAAFVSPRAAIPLRLRPLVEALAPVAALAPDGTTCRVEVPIRNRGGMRETGVLVNVPRPAGMTCAAYPLVGERYQATVAIDAYGEVTVPFEFAIDRGFVGRRLEIDGVVVVSPSSGVFNLAPLSIEIAGDVAFAASSISLEPGPAVDAGALVDVIVRAKNGGRSDAQAPVLCVELPAELRFVAGSIGVNGAANAEIASPRAIPLGRLRSQHEAIARFSCLVAAPTPHGAAFEIRAAIDDEEIDAYVGTIQSRASFGVAENYCAIEGSCTLGPSEERVVTVRVSNRGTDTSQPVRLRIDAPDLVVRGASVVDSDGARDARIVPILRRGGVPGYAIDLGAVAPYRESEVRVRIAAQEAFANESSMTFACFLREASNAELALGEIAFRGRALPSISRESRLASLRQDSLRLGQTRHLSLLLVNDGADVARDVWVLFDLPEGVRIESALGATLVDGRLRFAEIPARASTEATIAIRATSVAAGTGSADIFPVVIGETISTVFLEPLRIPTASQSFLDEGRVTWELLEDDSALRVRLTLRNIGDGGATRVIARASQLDGYVLNSTAVNGRTYRDIKGCSPLAYGFAVPEIAPGETLDISYVVRTKADESYHPEFRVESDEQDPLELRGDPYRARARHRFLPEILRIGEERGDVSLPAAAALEAIDEAEYRDEPSPGDAPRENVAETSDEAGDEHVSLETLRSSVAPAPLATPTEEDEPAQEASVTSIASPLRFGPRQRGETAGPLAVLRMDRRRIERVVGSAELLLGAEVGLYRHLFGMRLFMPDRVLGVSVETQTAWQRVLGAISEDFRAPLLRLVIPDFEPSLSWSESLEHDDVSEDVALLLREIPAAIANPIASNYDEQDEDVTTVVTLGNFGYVDPEEPATAHHLNAILPELIPAFARGREDLSRELARYKDALARNFRAIVYMGSQQRHERMCKAPTDELDEQLEAIVRALGAEVRA